MTYLGVTQQSADWLLERKPLRDLLHVLLREPRQLERFRRSELVEGPLRIAGTPDSRVLAVWNIDYLSGTGEESWGFLRLDQPNGIFGDFSISPEVFERCLYVINQRLQALLIDTAYIHRTRDGGVQTCLAGRGTGARQVSIGFKEQTYGNGSSAMRSVICVGPVWDFDELVRFVEKESMFLSQLRESANGLISSTLKRPVLDDAYFASLRDELLPSWQKAPSGFETVESKTAVPSQVDVYRSVHWTYEEWVGKDSPLSAMQRGILISDAIKQHPIRIIGPGGSGKTLLMLLITMRLLRQSKEAKEPLKILYVVHNQQMATKVRERFCVLGGEEFITGGPQSLDVSTLSGLAQNYLQLGNQIVIDVDAEKTKEFQLETVRSVLDEVISSRKDLVAAGETNLLREVGANAAVREAFARLVMAEISVAIKAHELTEDRKRYVESERPLSRMHGILQANEREFVYTVFEKYNEEVFERQEVLDSDDLAISYLGRLRTPISQLRRKSEGFDFVMVDETQLFNENERKIFALLTKGTSKHSPIALALDQAQEPYGQASAGLGVLGIDRIENETLPTSHRSTKQIIELAFFVLQRTTDLFNADFPDYTSIGMSMAPNQHPLAEVPTILECSDGARNLGKFIAKRVSDLRRSNVRQIAVVCHADAYWKTLQDELNNNKDLPLHVLRQRGENLTADQPLVVLSRPSYIGGQEFDAVIAVGLEQGVAPPSLRESPSLSATLEQQV